MTIVKDDKGPEGMHFACSHCVFLFAACRMDSFRAEHVIKVGETLEATLSVCATPLTFDPRRKCPLILVRKSCDLPPTYQFVPCSYTQI